jgi:hypothetical protein
MKHNPKLTPRTETIRHLTGAQLSRAVGGNSIWTEVDPPTNTNTKINMTTMTNNVAGSSEATSGGGADGDPTTSRTI